MYVASYNDVPHTEVGNNTLSLECNSTGYKYKVNGELQNSGWYTNTDTVDYKGYNRMYAEKNGNKLGDWWLASPSSYGSDLVCYVIGRSACLGGHYYVNTLPACPLVSLKSGIPVQVEE